jgi:hypothetical protein
MTSGHENRLVEPGVSGTRSVVRNQMPLFCPRPRAGHSTHFRVLTPVTRPAYGFPRLYASHRPQSSFPAQTPRVRASSATTPRLPDADLWCPATDQTRGLPTPAQGASAHAGVSDHAESGRNSRWRARRCCFRYYDDVGIRDYQATRLNGWPMRSPADASPSGCANAVGPRHLACGGRCTCPGRGGSTAAPAQRELICTAYIADVITDTNRHHGGLGTTAAGSPSTPPTTRYAEQLHHQRQIIVVETGRMHRCHGDRCRWRAALPIA